jgi:dethiobiotin synthetase
MAIPTVFIVGADKGGVGKTTLTRLLLDYFRANGVDFKAYDTEHPSGSLQRFFPEKVQIVDLTKSSDQMKVFDNLGTSQVTVIDIRAGLLSPMLKTLSEIGFMDAAKANKLRIVVLHVLGPSTQSLEEVKPVVAALTGARHIVVANHINDTEFAAPAGALDIPKLDELACGAVDKVALPFSEFVNSQASFVLRGKVRNWVAAVFGQFDAAKLSDLSVTI